MYDFIDTFQERTYSILIKTHENTGNYLKNKKATSNLFIGLVGEDGRKTKYARVPTSLQGSLIKLKTEVKNPVILLTEVVLKIPGKILVSEICIDV